MKKIWLHIVVLSFHYNVHAQFHEVGAFLGGANYIGDVGSSYFVYPENVAVGLVYKWNRTTRYSLRANIMYTKINKSDYNPVDFARFMRRYRFNNNILEFSAGAEINFVDFNLHGNDKLLSPYLFLGIGYIQYDLFYHDPITFETVGYGKGSNITLPAIVGLKANISPMVILGLEIGARYTFTDNLDGSLPKSESEAPSGYEFGNINNNDWYVFTGLTISFTFGDLPCYCK
ncbi:MAG: hypothetical protein CND43_00710 [Flavobacteriales bacterium MED-G15]|nr:MAG: hypothetical protein CND43_00710 [Flavobacteriales bacterium MED-G15]|tara:strand:+ start:1654 stop:2346 length:693 start_codon:yes stop_codon:yes gene_type:complete